MENLPWRETWSGQLLSGRSWPAASVSGRSAALWRRRTQWHERTGSDPDAPIARGLEAVERALTADPTRARAWAERAALELAAGNPEAAATASTEARRLNPLIELPGDAIDARASYQSPLHR